MITLKNIRVKGNLIYCEMYQDGNGNSVNLVFEFIDMETLNLKEAKPSSSDQKIYMQNRAKSLLLRLLELDGSLEKLRDYGELCWY